MGRGHEMKFISSGSNCVGYARDGIAEDYLIIVTNYTVLLHPGHIYEFPLAWVQAKLMRKWLATQWSIMHLNQFNRVKWAFAARPSVQANNPF